MELHDILPQAGDHEALNACHNITAAPVSLTLTHMAAALGNHEALRLLLERGAQVNVHAHKNATPIFYSATSSTTRLLLEFKADVNMQDDEGSYPLHYAASAEVSQLLLDAGADVNAVNFGRSTALHYAESWAVAEILILNGANMRAENNYNDIPFVLAVTKGRWSSVLCQLMYGAIRADNADDRAVFGRARSLSEQVLQAYRRGHYRHLFGPSSLLLSPPPLRPSITHDGRVKMSDTPEIKSSLSDVLAAKFECFGTTSVLNQLKTNVVLLLWAKAAAADGLNLPSARHTNGAGAALVRRERALPTTATPSPQQPARQAHRQRTNQIARAVADQLVWGPLSALCHHPLSAFQQATHLPTAVLRCIVNEFVGWWPLFWTDHLNQMARHASLPVRLASTPERASQHQSEIRSDVLFSLAFARMSHAPPAVRALWQQHTHSTECVPSVPFAASASVSPCVGCTTPGGVGGLIARLARHRHGTDDPNTVNSLMRRHPEPEQRVRLLSAVRSDLLVGQAHPVTVDRYRLLYPGPPTQLCVHFQRRPYLARRLCNELLPNIRHLLLTARDISHAPPPPPREEEEMSLFKVYHGHALTLVLAIATGILVRFLQNRKTA